MKALLVLVMMFLGASAHLCPKTCADNSTVKLRENYAIEPCTGHVAWYKLGSYCVKHINQMLDYTSAENHCKSVKSGAHLVSIHNAEDNNAVDEFSQWSSRHDPRIWLGGHAVNDPSQVLIIIITLLPAPTEMTHIGVQEFREVGLLPL
ncbi:lectin [Oncorhynchus kisutch]|uniref:lectin n=1 Tax=Oncorhynchus kisutch TaxID=8019 RepID=UPI0012DE83DB|nr:lectin [Oncorhynchus kisutch]